MIQFKITGSSLTFTVHVSPGASKKSIGGSHDGALRVSVNEAADKGRANAAVIRLISRTLGVSRSEVEITHGHTSRRKRISVATDSPLAVRRQIEELAQP